MSKLCNVIKEAKGDSEKQETGGILGTVGVEVKCHGSVY